MKKLLVVVMVFASSMVMAQSHQGTVEYDKTIVPCYIMELPFNSDVAQDAIKERFKKMGLSSKEKKGFYEYRNVVIPEISASPIDVLIKADRKSRKEKDITVLYMIVNPVGVSSNTTTTGTVADIGMGADGFLNSLKSGTEDLNLELEIKKQDDEVKKAEKKYKNLVDDADDMQKKLKRLQDDILENNKKQQDQTVEVQRQKEILLQMMGRRKQG